MSERALALSLVLVSVGCANMGCSRADVYPVTAGPEPEKDAGSSDADATPSACSSDARAPGDTVESVLVGTRTRSYVLHVPASYDGRKPAPLVIDFHGIGGSAESEASNSPYPDVLNAAGVVMAFPDGLRGPAGTAWNVGPCCVADVDDVAFARALVARIREQACIDPQRIYAVGVLTGGGMAQALACQAADVFAAIAPAAFDLLEETVGECAPTRPISVVSFRGTDDTRVPYAGGASSVVPNMPVTFLGARATFKTWAKLNGCAATSSAEDAQGCAHYSGCQDGAEVILCTKQGGREEPGDPSIAWPVLARHTL